MKKQFLILLLITFLCVCFCTLNDNRLQACGTDVAVCSVPKTCTGTEKVQVKSITTEFTGETDTPGNYFMNPFIPM